MDKLYIGDPILVTEIDWSVFNYAISIPSEYQEITCGILGITFKKGLTFKISLILDGNSYDAILMCLNSSSEEGTLQIRYSPKSLIIKKLKQIFEHSYSIIKQFDEQNYAVEKKLLTKDDREYIRIYGSSKDRTLEVECIKFDSAIKDDIQICNCDLKGFDSNKIQDDIYVKEEQMSHQNCTCDVANIGNETIDETPKEKLKTVAEYLMNAHVNLTNEQQMITIVLDNAFRNGIKLSSIIQIRKFLMEFSNTYPDYLLPSDIEILKEKIKEVAIQCDDDFFMTPTALVKDSSVIHEIITYIVNTFTSRTKVIYIENVYNRFKHKLLSTNIYSKEIFIGMIRYYLKDDVIYSKDQILLEYGAELNVSDDVLKVLSCSDTPKTKLEVYELLPHLSESKVEQILKSNKCSIYVRRNVYWHIDKFEVTEDDKYLLKEIICFEINNGFISVKKLLDILRSKAVHFLEKNNIINHVCLRDILRYHFSDVFAFQYTFIGKGGEEMSGVVAVRNWIANQESFKLADLMAYVEENGLPMCYELFLSEINIDFIRIDEQNFIKKDEFHIEDDIVTVVDELIDKYLNNGYVAISAINSYSIFPSIAFSWNCFLLKSIIENYCPKYNIFSISQSFTKPIGAVVHRDAGFKNYDEILEDVIVVRNKTNPFRSVKEAIEYLYEQGFLAKKRYKNINQVFNRAKYKNIKEQGKKYVHI